MTSRLLIMGAAVIVSTLASIVASGGWLVMVGPVSMAIALFWVARSAVRANLLRPDSVAAAATLGVGLVLASAIVALVDPFYVVVMLPVFAGPAVVVLAATTRESAGGC